MPKRGETQGWLRDEAHGGWLLFFSVPAAGRNRVCVMALFLSTYHKNIDKKGRVSVPVPFRAALSGQNFNGVVAYASFIHPCIEACGMDRIESLYEQIESLDPFSEERNAFETAILGGSVQLAFDGEGRISLPEELLEMSGIEGKLVFVGKGKTFEIWQPDSFADYEANSRALAKDKRLALRANTPKGGTL